MLGNVPARCWARFPAMLVFLLAVQAQWHPRRVPYCQGAQHSVAMCQPARLPSSRWQGEGRTNQLQQ